jgi:L-ribulose-5-phosphate 4-epimerase
MSAETGNKQTDRHACDLLVEITRELYQKGLITSTGGNLSIRSEVQEAIWITPSQIHKGKLNPDMLVCIDLEGNLFENTLLPPSSEKYVHVEIYKAYPEIQAVIHAHAHYSTTLVLTGIPFLPVNTEAAFIGELPRIPFIMPGTQDLARAVVEAMIPTKNHPEQTGWVPAVLMQNHGIVVAAADLRTAVNTLEIIEHTSHQIITCHILGIEPPVLPEEVVRALWKAGHRVA